MDEVDQRNIYKKFVIDYLSERIESITYNLIELYDAVEFVWQVEHCLDEFEGAANRCYGE